MRKIYFKKALMLFDTFKSYKLTEGDLDAAQGKATSLKYREGEFKLLIGILKDVFAGRYKMSKWNMSVIIATIVYVLSPIDAIPDIIPVVGWIDDITIVGYALSRLAEEIKNYKTFLKNGTQ